tara:strand:+ start:3699 stop:3980 length:282 start_codon:yes stop_codon:yes gene_type:complete
MIQEAGLVNLIKTIAIFFAVYYGFKFLAKYVFPWLLKRFINKQQEKFNQQYGSTTSDRKTNEGEVKITSAPNKINRKDDLGEYVDYEEITEDK